MACLTRLSPDPRSKFQGRLLRMAVTVSSNMSYCKSVTTRSYKLRKKEKCGLSTYGERKKFIHFLRKIFNGREISKAYKWTGDY